MRNIHVFFPPLAFASIQLLIISFIFLIKMRDISSISSYLAFLFLFTIKIKHI